MHACPRIAHEHGGRHGAWPAAVVEHIVGKRGALNCKQEETSVLMTAT